MGKWWIWVGMLGMGMGIIPRALAVEGVASYSYFMERTDSGTVEPYLDLYWEINPMTAAWERSGDSLQARFSVEIQLWGKGESAYRQAYILETPWYTRAEQARNTNIMEKQRLPWAPGQDSLRLIVRDLVREADPFVWNRDLKGQRPGQAALQLSGITLLDTFYRAKDTRTSRFLKEGYIQIPLCFPFMDDHRQRLDYYLEAYDWEREGVDPSLGDSCDVHLAIARKEDGPALLGGPIRHRLFREERMVIRGSMDLSALPSGNYYLRAWIQDGEGQITDQQALFFQRSNKGFVPEAKAPDQDTGIQKVAILDLSTTFLNQYDMAQLKAILKMLEPISTPVEKAAIENFGRRPEEIYMRYFIYNFWKSRSPDSPEKAWEDYANRVREVNRLFGSGSLIRGYETDRGYVYLKFGAPKERIPVLNESGSLPYEVWVYDGTPGEHRLGVFLFYQPGNRVGDFSLLHSSVRGEVRNTAWRSFLYHSGEPNPYSRAEQYPFP